MNTIRLLHWTVATVAVAAASALAGPSYFLIAERPGNVVHGDSFVVGMESPDLVAHARDLVRLGPAEAGAPILFAEVVAGRDGFNRDLRRSGAPQWSWHVSSVSGFGDFGIELIDGWPSYVESDVPGWIANTRTSFPEDAPPTGQIGFWNYTVVAELPADYPAGVTVIPLVPAAPAAMALVALAVCNRRVRRALTR